MFEDDRGEKFFYVVVWINVDRIFSRQEINARRKGDMKNRKQLKFVLNTAARCDLVRAMCFAAVLLAFFVIGPQYGSAQRLPNMAGNWSGTYTCAQGDRS